MPNRPIVAVTASTAVVNDSTRVTLNRAYVDALIGAGLVPVIVPPMEADGAPALLDAVQGLVLTGGEDVDPVHFGEPRHPATGPANALRDRCELALAREAAARRLPTLAICRGVQVLNVALGGTLVQDIPSQVGRSVNHDAAGARDRRVHPVTVEGGSRLAEMLGATAISTNSFHHQSVARVGKGLRVAATTTDGVIEAVESTDGNWWAVGVQWHPEELTGDRDGWDRKLLERFARELGGG